MGTTAITVQFAARRAWQEAVEAWAGAGDNPKKITALVQAGLLYLPNKKSEAEKLFAQSLAVGKLKTRAPACAS